MRSFKNCEEAMKELPREIFSRGVLVQDKTVQGKDVSADKGFQQKELFGMAFIINDISDKDRLLEIAKELFDKSHLSKEVGDQWVWDMLNNITTRETWFFKDKFSTEYFKKFCNEKNTGASTYGYGERVIPQLPFVIERLKHNLYARGAYIAVHDSRDVSRIGRRIPCTLSYGFSVRRTVHGDKLNIIVHQRSCDLVNFMALDIYKAISLLEHVAREVGVKTGKLIMYVDSLHAYLKDVPNNLQW